MSEIVQANLNEAVPKRWQENYADIVLTKTKHGQEYLFGVDKETGHKIRLPKGVLDSAVSEFYNVELRTPDEAKNEAAQQSDMERKLKELEEKIESLQRQKAEQDEFKTNVEMRLDNMQQVLEAVERALRDNGINTLDIRSRLTSGDAAVQLAGSRLEQLRAERAAAERPAPPTPESQGMPSYAELAADNARLEATVKELRAQINGETPPAAKPEAPPDATKGAGAAADTENVRPDATAEAGDGSFKQFSDGATVRSSKDPEKSGKYVESRSIQGRNYAVIESNGEYQLIPQDDVEVVDGGGAVPPPAETSVTEASGRVVPDNYRRIPLRSGRLASRWNRWRGIPPTVNEIYENRDTGRRLYYSETEKEWVPIERDRGTLIAIFAGTAAVASVIGLGFHIHNKHDLEELEHRKAQPVYVKPVVVKPRVTVPTTTESEPSEQQPTTTTETEPTTTTTETEPSAAPGTTTTTENENENGSQDRDEPLNGGRSYFENSKKGGHGLELDYPKDTSVEKNSNGTYIFTASNGKRIRLTWNASGSLSPDTVNSLEANGYEVGKAKTRFSDRENGRYQHYYSVIGDKDS